MLIKYYLGSQIRSLIHELKLLSGKQFRHETILSINERLGKENRVDLMTFVNGKIAIVDSLVELKSVFCGVQASLLCNRRLNTGYERVIEKYHMLLMQKWVITADKIKSYPEVDSGGDFRVYAYGLIDIDLILLDELRIALQQAKKKIEDTPQPDFVPTFRIDYLTNDLIKAHIPINGLNLQGNPTYENDATPCEYFQLKDGRYIRCTIPEQTSLSEDEREKAYKIIFEHAEKMKKQEEITEVIRIALARNGYKISSLRFNRSESELKFNPERFIAVDTDIGILEIRVYKSLQIAQRRKIQKIAEERLLFCNVSILPLFDSSIDLSQQTMPVSSAMFDYQKLTDDLIQKSIRLQERRDYHKYSENFYNDQYTDFLRDKGYNVADQSRGGLSEGGKQPGSLDIKILNSEGSPASIIESLKIKSNNRNYIATHISKLLHRYDCSGHKRNFIIVFVESNSFIELWEKYFEFIKKELSDHGSFEGKHKLIGIVEEDTGKSDVKFATATHLREGSTVEIIHLFLNLGHS